MHAWSATGLAIMQRLLASLAGRASRACTYSSTYRYTRTMTGIPDGSIIVTITQSAHANVTWSGLVGLCFRMCGLVWSGWSGL